MKLEGNFIFDRLDEWETSVRNENNENAQLSPFEFDPDRDDWQDLQHLR